MPTGQVEEPIRIGDESTFCTCAVCGKTLLFVSREVKTGELPVQRRKMKYTDKLSKIDGCPPKTLVRRQGAAFRFVFSDNNNPNSFLPPAVIKPGRFVTAAARLCCSGYALSMYETKAQILQRAREAQKSNPQFLKRIGDHVAELHLEDTDGLSGAASKTGHFDFFEAANFIGEKRVVAVEKVRL